MCTVEVGFNLVFVGRKRVKILCGRGINVTLTGVICVIGIIHINNESCFTLSTASPTSSSIHCVLPPLQSANCGENRIDGAPSRLVRIRTLSGLQHDQNFMLLCLSCINDGTFTHSKVNFQAWNFHPHTASMMAPLLMQKSFSKLGTSTPTNFQILGKHHCSFLPICQSVRGSPR